MRLFPQSYNRLGWRNTLEEMVADADARAKYLGIADHSKSSFQANGLDEERLARQVEAIHQLTPAVNSRRMYLPVLKSIFSLAVVLTSMTSCWRR